MGKPHNTAELSGRERSILHHIVDRFIRTAIPVGSRFISRNYESHLSPATIRNVMADLEEQGYLAHPHTSAGRVPTDLGYRYYVDYLMEIEGLPENDLRELQDQLDKTNDPLELLRETSRLLSRISKQLSIVSSPHLSKGRLEKLELIQLSSTRLLVVMSVMAGLVKTLMLEVQGEVKRDDIERLSRILNERLSGLTIQEIRDTFANRVRDLKNEKTGLVRLFVDSVDLLFQDEKTEKLHISGTQNIIEQPEFVDPKNFRSVIELIENEEIIVHLLEKSEEGERGYAITIGGESNEIMARDYSVVTSTYEVLGVKGKVGIIGPKRMNYAKVIPLVDHVAKTIKRMLASQ